MYHICSHVKDFFVIFFYRLGADTAKLVLEHAKNLHAYQIAHDFKVRKMVREAFFERARISTRPTKNGQREIGKLYVKEIILYNLFQLVFFKLEIFPIYLLRLTLWQ